MNTYLQAALDAFEISQGDVSGSYGNVLKTRIDMNLRFSIAESLARIAAALEAQNAAAEAESDAKADRGLA